MGRMYRRRYFKRTKRVTKKALMYRRRALLRKRIKRFVNKMGYPTYVKMVGMTESKKLLLRKTLTLDAPYSTHGNTNIFQIILDPLECPNISKAFATIKTIQHKKNETDDKTEDVKVNRYFKYDYMRIKNIFISIRPAQTVSTTNGKDDNLENLYGGNGDTPISNVYAYFTYKFPEVLTTDPTSWIETMYGTNPFYYRIDSEGKTKNTYSWPSNKPITISLNKLMYRVNTVPHKIFSNSPLDLQYLKRVSKEGNDKVFNPFGYSIKEGNGFDSTQKSYKDESIEEYDDDDDRQYQASYTPDEEENAMDIPDLQNALQDIFFGRLVIVSPKKVRFTVEICYDCVLLR